MDKAIEQQESGSNQSVSKTQPVARWAQDISKRVKTFFTLTEEEKDAAGISDYKNYHT